MGVESYQPRPPADVVVDLPVPSPVQNYVGRENLVLRVNWGEWNLVHVGAGVVALLALLFIIVLCSRFCARIRTKHRVSPRKRR
jgi:hypothetical protein